MPLIEWDDSFSVNNAEIDAQHKKWIAILNELDETLLKGSTQEKNKITTDSLKAMCDYARDHFKFEEEYMEKINYPYLREHWRIHKDFDNQIYEYDYEMRTGNVVLNSEIISLLKNWLLDHILNEDKKYSHFAAGEK